MRAPVANRLLLLVAAVLFSTGGAAIKATALTSWQVASFRSAVAALALLLLVPAARAGWNWRVGPVGVAYASTLVLFVLATKLTTAANAIFLQSTGPLYLLLLGPLVLREPLRRRDIGLIAVVGAGMALFFAGQEAASPTAPDPLHGNVLGACSGVTWACTIAGLRWLGSGRAGNSAPASVAAGNLLAFLACLPMALPVSGAQWRDAAVILYLGVFQIGLSYFCLTRAIRHVPALEAAILLLAEPALNPVWAWLAHGERPGRWALAGGALILTTSVVNTWLQSRDAKMKAYG
ncbi:MAG: DMT family transporter [Acidobacteriota bacterium]